MDFIVDRRDIEFVLFEYLGIEKLLKFDQWKDFTLDDFKMTLGEAIKSATGILAPVNALGDEEGAHFDNGKVTLPKGFKEAYQQYCAAGWLGMSSPIEWGGQGLPQTLGLACSEAFVSANNSLTMAPGLTHGAANLLEAYGNDEQKNTYLAKLLSGEWCGTMCLTEPQAGSAVGDTKAQATPAGDGRWKIVGTKSFITFGDHSLTDNIMHLVLARTPGAPAGFQGISLFIVPKFWPNPDGTPGAFNDVRCSGIEHKMGIHGSPTCTLNFGDEGKCYASLVGVERKGLIYMFKLMNEARVGVGLQGMSQASLAYQLALKYSKERIQGTHILAFKDANAPRVEIIQHPDVRRMLMDMKSNVEGSRALLMSCAFFGDMYKATKDESWEMLIELLTPVCKAFCTDVAFDVAELAIQVHGGYGYCAEYGVEQLCRDIKIASIYEGTNGIQALDLVGRKLGAKGGMFLMNFLNRVNAFTAAQGKHPVLGGLVKELDTAKNKVIETAMNFGMKGRDNPLYPVSYATPFLEMFGQMIFGYLLLDMAVVANVKLEALYADKGAADDAAKKKLRTEHADTAYYHGKVQTARYYIKQTLPRVHSTAAAIASEDLSLLDIEL